jgi:holdfast attachment protein HfaA
MARTYIRRMGLAAAAGLAVLTIAGLAQAQMMTTNSASFNAGYGRYSGQENQPVNAQTTDVNNNTVLINGLFQASSTSIFAGSSARLSGAADSFSGAGGVGGSSTAIGNSLNVVVDGSYNTVIVQSQQTNNGDVTATTTTYGKP